MTVHGSNTVPKNKIHFYCKYLDNFHRNTDIKFNPKALKFTHLVKCKITQNSYKLQEYLALQLTIG